MNKTILVTGASSGFGAMELDALAPDDADPEAVGRAIVEIVAMPHGRRPFRLHVDPSRDGAEIVNGVADRVRGQLLERIGLADLPHPSR